MKTITIGRGEGCDIFIDDYRISRRHAILKIYPLGKMEIVDLGQNGTWVNGVKLRPNVPFPVRRRDVVAFAEVSRLNWAQVPDILKSYKIGAAIVGSIIAVITIIFVVVSITSSFTSSDSLQEEPVDVENTNTPTIMKDSVSSNQVVGTNVSSQQTRKNDDVSRKTLNELFPHKDKKKKEKKDEIQKEVEKDGKNKNNKPSKDSSDENSINDIF